MLRLIDPKQSHKRRFDEAPDMLFHLVPMTLGASKGLIGRLGSVTSGDFSMTLETMTDMFLSNVAKVDGVVWPGAADPVSITSADDKVRFLTMLPMGEMGFLARVCQAIQEISSPDEGEEKNFGGSPDSKT